MIPSPELHPWLWSIVRRLRMEMTDPASIACLNRMTPDEQLELAWREAQDPVLTLRAALAVPSLDQVAAGAW